MEQFKNFATSSLNGAINSSVTTVTVNNGGKFPSTGTFRVLVDSEIMKCTARSTNDLTVVRGDAGTTAASHADTSIVNAIITAEAMEQFRADNVSGGTRASIFSASKDGRIYVASDAPYLTRDMGSSLSDFGLVWPMIPPDNASYSWANQGSSTVNNTNKGIYLNVPASFNLTSRYKTFSISAPCTLTAHVVLMNHGVDSNLGGIGVRESSSGKMEGFHFTVSTTVMKLQANKWGNTGSNFGTRTSLPITDMLPSPEWLQIYYDNTNITFRWSSDGFNFQDFVTFAKNDFLTSAPDQWMICATPFHGSVDCGIFVDHWNET